MAPLPLLSQSSLSVPGMVGWKLLKVLLGVFVNLDPGCRHIDSFLFKVTIHNAESIKGTIQNAESRRLV